MIDSFNKLPLWLRLGIIFPLAFLNIWLLFLLINYLEPLDTIFITAAILAFLLNIPIGFLEKRNIPKGWAISLVFLVTLIVLGLIAFILIPLIIKQLSELLNVLPQWIESGSRHIQAIQQWAIAQRFSLDFQNIINQLAQELTRVLQSFGNQLLSILGGTISTILNAVLVLVLTVFLVLTGEQVWTGIFNWIPQPWNVELRLTIRKTFENYFATQAILAGIASIVQTIVFVSLQVPYAVLFGVTIGVATLIPFGGTVTVILISSILMFEQFSLGIKALIVTIIVGQINDNVISPRLMGESIGLNPVWIIVSLFIGGKIGGFLGLLIAVPLASVIKTIADTLRNRSLGFPERPSTSSGTQRFG